MFTITKNPSPKSARLERWLGAEKVALISDSMRHWPGPPIAISGVPGRVWAHGGGDFAGTIKSGQFLSALEFGLWGLKRRLQSYGLKQRQQCHAGFSSLSDLIAEATTGKRRDIMFQKNGVSNTTGFAGSLWGVGAVPALGAAGSAAPGGRALTNATTGAIPGLDDVSPDTRHFVLGNVSASVAANTLLLYDRIFDVAKTMNSTATEAVTGVPTRYQSNTPTDMNYAGGNFCFVEVQSTIAGTAHDWTVCQYRNQAGTDNQSFPSMTGTASNAANRLDHPIGSWFMPLAAGDSGVADLAQMQCSALVATGTINFVIGHPLALMPCPIASVACQQDGINTAFNLVRIFDGAALAFLEINKPASTATNYNGVITLVSG